jgi:hypothetical protein
MIFLLLKSSLLASSIRTSRPSDCFLRIQKTSSEWAAKLLQDNTCPAVNVQSAVKCGLPASSPTADALPTSISAFTRSTLCDENPRNTSSTFKQLKDITVAIQAIIHLCRKSYSMRSLTSLIARKCKETDPVVSLTFASLNLLKYLDC